MARLTKYDSFEALKADAASTVSSSSTSEERYLAFEKFIASLQPKKRNKKPKDIEHSTKENI